MAVCPPSATFEEFSAYVVTHKGEKTDAELSELWDWRQKLLGLKVITGAGYRSQLPADEQDLTLRQREQKIVQEEHAQGRDPVPVGNRWV